MPNFLIGRQPIYDRHHRLFGYELLYRDLHSHPPISGTQATEQLVVDALLELGLETLSGNTRVFINLTRENLLSDLVHSLPASQVVIEVLETVAVDDTLVRVVHNLVRSGYTIALDDFVFALEWEPLLELAHIVKIDVLAHSGPELETLIQRLRSYGVQLLAEKVESETTMQRCLDLGCHYFQGYHLQRPQLVQGKRLSANNLAKLRLLAAINDPSVKVEQLDNIVRTDPGLSFKLLKFINSARFALPVKVESIERAIVLLGLTELKRWATLLVLSETTHDSPTHTLYLALSRARMCEQLAREVGLPDGDAFFLVGLLSVLETFLQTPMTEILRHLPLAEPVTEGLLGRGPAGEALRCIFAYENWDMGSVRFHGLSLVTLGNLYLESLHWAAATVAEIL